MSLAVSTKSNGFNMKIKLLILPLLLLCACRCRSVSHNKETSQVQQPMAASSEKLLRKVIGGQSNDSQVFDCSVLSSDVPDAASVKKLIADMIEVPLIQALHIVATIPSIEYYAYQGETQIVIYTDYSDMHMRQDKDNSSSAAAQLTKILDSKCPTPPR